MTNVPGDIRDYYGNPVRVVEWNGCLVRVETLRSELFLVRPELLKPITAEQFTHMDYWDVSKTEMGSTEKGPLER